MFVHRDNTTVTGTILVHLLCSFGQPKLPFLLVRTASLVIFLNVCSVSLSPWLLSLTNVSCAEMMDK